MGILFFQKFSLEKGPTLRDPTCSIDPYHIVETFYRFLSVFVDLISDTFKRLVLVNKIIMFSLLSSKVSIFILLIISVNFTINYA